MATGIKSPRVSKELLDATTTTATTQRKQTLSRQNKVDFYNSPSFLANKTMPGLRIGLQTVAVSNGYDPSFQLHAKFGTLIKIKASILV